MSYHHTLIRMTGEKKKKLNIHKTKQKTLQDSASVGGKIGHLESWNTEYKMMWLLWKTIWEFLKMLQIESLLVIYRPKSEYGSQK